MNTIRRLNRCALLLLFVLGLAGCSSEPQKPPQDPELFKKEVDRNKQMHNAERNNKPPQEGTEKK